MSTQTSTTPEVPRFELRHRMHRAMEWANLGPDDMAAEVGRGVTTIRNYLAGRTSPTRAVLIAWAMRCGVPFSWLDTGEEPADPPDGNGQVLSGYPGWFRGTPVEVARKAS